MYTVLDEIKNKKILAAFYTDRDDGDKFAVGYVQTINTEAVVIVNVGIHGEFDGFTVCYIEDIFKVEVESLYLNKIEKLLRFDIDSYALDISGNLFEDMLHYALANQHVIICIMDTNDSIIGLVSKIADSTISVKQINEYGQTDGICSFPKDDITKIMIKDMECTELEKIMR